MLTPTLTNTTTHPPHPHTPVLLQMFVDKCEDLDLLAQRLVPALLDPILGDYARSVPDAR